MQVENQRGIFRIERNDERVVEIIGRQEYSPSHPKRVDVWVVRALDKSEREFTTYKLVRDHLADRYCNGKTTLVKIEWLRS